MFFVHYFIMLCIVFPFASGENAQTTPELSQVVPAGVTINSAIWQKNRAFGEQMEMQVEANTRKIMHYSRRKLCVFSAMS